MTTRYHLNLANRRFRRYRLTNLVLGIVLAAIVGFGVWEGIGLSRYSTGLVELRALEREARVEWEFLGARIEELRDQLQRPDALEDIEEIRFLNTIHERKRFSWTMLLREIEQAIPRTVYIVSLAPNIDEDGSFWIETEARGRSVDALSLFLSNLEASPLFSDVSVVLEEQGEDQDGEVNSAERRMLIQVDYRPPGTTTQVRTQ